MRFSRLVITLALGYSAIAFGQIRWVDRNFDFGLFREEEGVKRGEVRFVNNGSEPVAIVDAKVSCGCTAAEYSDTPVMPGDTATLRVSYDPKGRPGKFDKSVRVYFSDGRNYLVRVQGNVLGTPESLAQFYPQEVGPLRLSTPRLDVGEIQYGHTRNYFITAYNQSLQTLKPEVTTSNPALSIRATADTIAPGETVTYSLMLDTRKAGKQGLLQLPIQFKVVSEDSVSEYPLPFAVQITPPQNPTNSLKKDSL